MEQVEKISVIKIEKKMTLKYLNLVMIMINRNELSDRDWIEYIKYFIIHHWSEPFMDEKAE